ncbi:MAG: universal stress protein [Bacteroidales bacterium]|nr:universal stress protein [Bacteroidales bacterium]
MMDETLDKKPILVPWDYSQKAEYALLHAIDFALALHRDVVLVHITKDATDNALNVERLNLKAEEIMHKYGIRPGVIVRTGNIFTEIKQIIAECNAELAVMGTHGLKGLQKFTGSWALKVITGSKAPFVVVQDRPTAADIRKVVLPVDFKLEERQKLVWVQFIAKTFRCKFYLSYIENSDQQIRKRTQANISAAIKFLETNQINYELQRLAGKEGLANETISFAQSIGSGLIIIMTTKNIRFQDYVLGAAEQQIIANEAKIPVMCVNPME